MARTLVIALTLLALGSGPALAGNKLISPGASVQVAKSTLTVTPTQEWNKLGARPGSLGENWTMDGDALNKITFFGGISEGQTLLREVDRKNNPLPKVSATMLVTDIPPLLESSYRIALGTSLFSIDAMEPTQFAGRKGVKFLYSFVVQGEDVRRKGEAYGAMVDGKLYMMSYEAPALYYFDKDIEGFRGLIASARL